MAWAVNITGDGRLVVAAFPDGTIRWYRAEDGEELLTLFIYVPENPEAEKRWIVWTPKGYYTASPGGEDLIGWHVNRGPNETADFFSVSRFRDQFYRPDIVGLVLDTLDEGKAIESANRKRHVILAEKFVRRTMPPVVTILRLHDGDPVTSAEMTVQYAVRSPAGLPVTRVFAQVNGLPVKEAETEVDTQAPANEEIRGVLKVNVPEQVKVPQRDFNLSVIAEANDRTSEPATIQLHWMGPPAPVEPPVLYALIIGVGHYDKHEYALGDFPARDVDALVEQLLEQKGLAFRDVRIRALKDHQKGGDELDRDWFQRTDGKKAASATRENIIAGLQWLKNEVQDPSDIAVVFFSGHGKTENGTSYLLPVDFDPENDLSTTLDKATLRGALRGINGHKLLILDACYAGKGMFDTLDTTDLGNDFGQPQYSIMTLASSLATERSYADDKGSFFARALIEALRGLDAASAADGKITTAEFAPWAKRRVKDLIKDPDRRQTPFVVKPALWTDDLRLAVVPQ